MYHIMYSMKLLVLDNVYTLLHFFYFGVCYTQSVVKQTNEFGLCPQLNSFFEITLKIKRFLNFKF